jgi:hypothetical protein
MTPKSEEFLRDLGVWEPLENAGRTQPYAAMQVCAPQIVVHDI